MTDTVSSAKRDQTFLHIRSTPQNKFCIDCEKKNPSWCSIYLGIHLCMDCAGKHRQYGVMYSFVKSANLDSWNTRQLQFMVKGGNAKALEYLRKAGVISAGNKVIDYKSAIVQRYKELLTAEVDGEVGGGLKFEEKKVESVEENKKEKQKEKQKETNLQNHAEEVKEEIVTKKGKGKKKIQATKINIQEFDNIEFDNGISKAQKEAMIKASQSALNAASQQKQKQKQSQSASHQSTEWSNPSLTHHSSQPIKPQAPKWVDQQTAKQTIEKLKQQKDLKNISSNDFVDSKLTPTMQKNLQKLEGRTGFGSSDLSGEEPEQESAASKIKNAISDYGQNLYDKWSKYMKK